MKTKLDKLKDRYEKVCSKLEQLNDEAFELEKEIMYQRGKLE